MTKLKSKKMTKSTFAVIIMAVVMVAMLAFGGTYAYFTATTSVKASETVSTATISLKNNNIVVITTGNVVPGENILQTGGVSVQNFSTRASYIFVKVQASAAAGTATLDVTEETTWSDYHDIDPTVDVGTVFYQKANAVATGNVTTGESILFSNNIKFDATANMVDGTVDGSNNAEVMGTTITVKLVSAATQADALQGADETAQIKSAYGLVSASLVIPA